MKILVTGFDPFGGELVNPAIETVKRLRDNISGAEIIKLEIPTVCHKSLRVIEEAVVNNLISLIVRNTGVIHIDTYPLYGYI